MFDQQSGQSLTSTKLELPGDDSEEGAASVAEG